MSTRQNPGKRFNHRLFWSKVLRGDGCWEWGGCRRKTRWAYGWYRRQPAHRIAWELHFGPIPDDLQVLHSCDNPPCVLITHLFLGTQRDNMRDMYTKGRGRPRGFRVGKRSFASAA